MMTSEKPDSNESSLSSYPHLFVVVMFIVIISASLLSLDFISKQNHENSHLAENLGKVKTNISMSHLWLEEGLTGDTFLGNDYVVEKFNFALRYLDTILSRKQEHDLLFAARISDPELNRRLESVRSKIMTLKKLALEYKNNRNKYKLGSRLDQRFDEVYVDVMFRLDNAELTMLQMHDRNLTKQERLFKITFALGATIILVMLGILFKQERVRRRAEQALRKGDERYRLLVDGAKIVVWEYDWKNDRFTYVSGQDEKIMGYPRAEWYEPGFWRKNIHPDDKDKTSPLTGASSVNLENSDSEYRMIGADGGLVWVRNIIRAYGAGEMPASLVGIMIDITTRKKATEDLERMFNLSGYMVCIADMSGYFTKVSPAFEASLGYDSGELLSRPVLEFVHPDEKKNTESIIRRKLFRGVEVIHYENRYLCKDGSYKWLSWTSRPVVEEGVSMTIAVDISDWKKAEEEKARLEERIAHTRKMESLIAMAGGVAHDFNNLLMCILGNTEHLLSTLPQNSPLRECLLEIESATSKATRLSHQMLAYSGKGKFIKTTFNLNDEIIKLEKQLRGAIPDNIRIWTDLSDLLPTVEGDIDQLNQAIRNLVINATEAIGANNGLINICTEPFQYDGIHLLDLYMETQLPEGLYVSVEVTDSGVGMDEDTLEKVFDPFYTTKFTGRGLGMSSVLGIVLSHHGAISVTSKLGQGASFKILLPASKYSSTT